ncbi:MAG TPA: hypothetical protein VFQ61_00190, partial [Polyangiaceae bacterium]|nr:hypothetical protein [Polyangiaceae bacterium]
MRRDLSLAGLVCFAAMPLAGCSSEAPASSTSFPQESASEIAEVTGTPDRLAACNQDPRVRAGLVSPEVCAGADVFFRETFAGNGRTCGSCHPVANNTTLDEPFIQALHQTNPADPLFVFERDANLSQLETADLLNAGAVLENLDGFEDPAHKFVSRTVNHVLSLATSTRADPADGTDRSVKERTGWSGDGAPDDGTLRSFLVGAIRQHFTKTLTRREGTDFRLPTQQELDLTRAFQLSLGRTNELDLTQVRLSDADAEQGRQAFLDPNRGRCNVCHSNAGANFLDTGLNRNFDTGVRTVVGNRDLGLTTGNWNNNYFVDGGFGATTPFDADGSGTPNSLGNGTFNPPPLIEAADTGPFFHNNARGPEIEDAVAFYASAPFKNSPAAAELDKRFGASLELAAFDSANIARLLRVLNAAFNLDIALQRLNAANTLASSSGDQGADVQQRLIE